VRLTVLGGCGGWPAAGLACSGYLVEQDGFRLLIDPGYAILPRLLAVADADAVDAVLVSHGHPEEAVRAAAGSYPGEIAVAAPGLVAEPGLRGE
jgi:glyoxylase-like metal-dependent hydrolase (beta-lactamase superfamily II)